MTQQKSEQRTVAQARGNSGPTQGTKRLAGAKALPVRKQTHQLQMPFAAAETPDTGSDGELGEHHSEPGPSARPRATSNEQSGGSVTMRRVCEHLDGSFEAVARNKGASGPDRQSIDQVRKHWSMLREGLMQELTEGTYRPGEVRRVWIPKSSGGKRPLGIPNVLDRVVQEAVRRVLEPLYEPTFHEGSHGFRPGRSCHTAIAAAREHLETGSAWVVDIDLENYFGTVHHQRLMNRLAQRVRDKSLLVLIGRMLKAKVVLPSGLVESVEQGVPQGGPLSPLLSNIVLDELDRELSRRGHRFVRYADDCNIYVKSERAGERVMASIKAFLEGRMRLKVNAGKSAVARPEERHFVGFRLRREPEDGNIEVLLSRRSEKRIADKILQLTPRNWGKPIEACIAGINEYVKGWVGFFGICTKGVQRTLSNLDAHLRRRLRAIQLKQWKRKRTIARKLIAMGIRRATAWRTVYSKRRSLWALSHTPAVDRALRNGHWTARGLESILDRWQASPHHITAPKQLSLGIS